MPSKKRIKEIEHNVFKNETDSGLGNFTEKTNAVCVTLIGGIIVTILIFVIAAGGMQIGKGRPAHTCAALGCGKTVKSGSNYCWLHSATYPKRRNNKKDIDFYDSKDSGSVTNGGGSDKKTEAKSAGSYGSIYDGMEDSENGSGNAYGSGSGGASGSIYGGSSDIGSGSSSGSSSSSGSGVSSGADSASGK